MASSDTKLGVHILEPEEIVSAIELLPGGGYVTVPIRLDQFQPKRWQEFFDLAAENRITPIIRLATRLEDDSWSRPTRKGIVSFADFLNSLDWRTDRLIVVVFNEPNHALEWGGEVDPESYGRILAFAVSWFNTEKRDYLVLPAALDAAAGFSAKTMPARKFLSELIDQYPEVFSQLDGWNSHAYPNPHFSGRPTDTHASSILSYKHELSIIKDQLGLTLPVYITETGWDKTQRSQSTIASFFRFAYEEIWAKDNQVVSVTPFLLNAQFGPFTKFSLIDQNHQPTPIYQAVKGLSSKG